MVRSTGRPSDKDRGCWVGSEPQGSQKRENRGFHLEHLRHETETVATRQVKTYGSISEPDSQAARFQVSKLSNQHDLFQGGLSEKMGIPSSHADQTRVKM